MDISGVLGDFFPNKNSIGNTKCVSCDRQVVTGDKGFFRLNRIRIRGGEITGGR